LVFLLFKILFIYFREGAGAEGEGEGERQAGSLLSMEPVAGLDLRTLNS